MFLFRSRYPFLFLCACFAFLGSLTALLGTSLQRDQNLRGYVDPTQTQDLPFRIPRLGVNAELTQYNATELPRQFALMQAAKITWVRQVAYWDQIEPLQGEFDWSVWDRITSALTDFPDLRLVVVFMHSPEWARTLPDDPTTPPDDPAAFARFVRIFAERYGSSIDHYQIWDEPNLQSAWGGREPRVADYFALLQAGYNSIHAIDPGATVISASLAPTTETRGLNISDWRYLNDLYALGAADYMDAVAGKPYGFNSDPNERMVSEDTLNFSRVIGLREVMTDYQDGQTALWATHWGWNSLPTDWNGNPSIWGSVDQTTQITYTLAALDRADREWPWLGAMILFHWQPDAPLDDPLWGFTLIDPEDRPTPLYEALVNYTPIEHPSNGLYPAANPYTEYSGVWTFSDLGADIGWLRDSRFSFNFYGSDVGLILRKDDYIAYLYPQVNGAPANALPRDGSGNSYLILQSGSLEPELGVIKVAENLPIQTHTLTAVADRGFDRWALVGYAVSSGDLYLPYQRQIAVASLTTALSLIAVIVMGTQVAWRKTPFMAFWNALSALTQLIITIITSVALLIGFYLTWGEATPTFIRREPIQLGLSILTAGLIYLNPALPLTIFATIVLFVILYNRPAFGLALTLFYAPFFLFPVELFVFAFPMAELVLLITFAAWALHQLVAWGKLRRSDPTYHPFKHLQLSLLDYAVMTWVILGAFTLFWVEQRGLAITELRTLIIEPALLYLMFRTLRLTQADLLRVIDALLAAGFMVAIIGLALYLRSEGIITAEDSARRLASVYGSPNNVALFLGRCIPFALAMLLLPLNRTRRMLAALCLGVMLLAAGLTQSVGGLFIGIPAAIGAVLIVTYGRKALLPLIALILLGGVAFGVLATQSERFARAVDFTQGTNLIRIRLWQSSLEMIADRPITGLGLDQFLYQYRGTYIKPDAEADPNLSHPHNYLFDFWLRLGIMGVALFFTFQWGFWRSVLRLRAISLDIWGQAILIGLIGSMVNLLAHGLIDNSVYVLDLAYVFAFQLALANMRSIDAKPDQMV
jgi:O-antigen ligase